MSITEPEADGAQPSEGQGGGGEAPYAEYLNRVPEEYRGDVEPIFKEWDAGVTRKFQDAAEYRRQWEPYEQAGINQMDPEQLQWALQVAQAAQNDPQALREWLDQQHGPIAAPEQFGPAQDYSQQYGYEDPNQQFEQLLAQRLGPLEQQLQGFQQWQEQYQQEQLEQQLDQVISAEIVALKEQHAATLPKEVIENLDDIIERFGMKYAQPGADPKRVVEQAFGDFQRLTHTLDKAALQAKVGAPAPAEGGGVPDTSPEKIKNFKDAEEIAKQYLRNENRA